MIEGKVLLLKKDDLIEDVLLKDQTLLTKNSILLQVKGHYPNGIIFYLDEGTGGGH